MIIVDLAFISTNMALKKISSLLPPTISCLIFIICSGFLSNIYAQDNNKLSKANTLYKAKRYAEAIPIYEEILEDDLNKSVLIKLARSHRIINNSKEALIHYTTLIAQPEPKAEHQLEYIELLIINGDYTEAKRYLREIESTNTNIEQILNLTSMINNNFEIDSMYQQVQLESFIYNTPLTDENSPYLIEGKIIYTSDSSPYDKLKNKSGWTGRAFYKVWESELKNGVYSTPQMFSKAVNATNKNTANVVFDWENNEVFFTKNDNAKDRKDFYNMQLYSSPIRNGKFGKAQKLSVNNKEYNYMHPCISKDGKTLLYVSDRSGEGGTDIYIAKRTSNGWSRGKNLGGVINTKENEGFPFLDVEGNLYFCSKGHSGLGGYDIFYAAKEEDGSWSSPKNLGRPFNSQHDDISIFLKSNGIEGAFTSSRNGSDDIFLFTIGEQ